MNSINLNINPTIIKSPKAIYKGQTKFKEYSTKGPISKIKPKNETSKLRDLSINRKVEIISPPSLPSSILSSSNYPVIKEHLPSVLSESSQLMMTEFSSVQPTRIKEIEVSPIVTKTQERFIDLTSLRETIGQDNLNFDCGPLRNVYNYESQYDESGAIEFLLTSSKDNSQLMFPQELEYQEKIYGISLLDKILYYLFGIDKDHFFELSSRRDYFYNFPTVVLTQPFIYPEDSEEYDDTYFIDDVEESIESNYFLCGNNSLDGMV